MSFAIGLNRSKLSAFSKITPCQTRSVAVGILANRWFPFLFKLTFCSGATELNIAFLSWCMAVATEIPSHCQGASQALSHCQTFEKSFTKITVFSVRFTSLYAHNLFSLLTEVSGRSLLLTNHGLVYLDILARRWPFLETFVYCPMTWIAVRSLWRKDILTLWRNTYIQNISMHLM